MQIGENQLDGFGVYAISDKVMLQLHGNGWGVGTTLSAAQAARLRDGLSKILAPNTTEDREEG